MLNRRSGHASAVLVAQGRVKLGVEDDDATLLAGEGVLLERGAIYSLQAVRNIRGDAVQFWRRTLG